MTVVITIVDVDAGVSLAERQAAAAALQRQAIEHFMPQWGVGASVRAATPANPPVAGEWIGELRSRLDDADAGALAVHGVQPDGTPVMRVDVGACRQYQTPWTSALSHEICEALADPAIRWGAQDDRGTWWALEVSDAVQASDYSIDGVAVSNFCYPSWFAPPSSRAGVLYDHGGCCSKPFEVLPGGYAQTWDPRKGWAQLGQMSPYRAYLARLGAGRGARRPKVHQNWWRRALAWCGLH